LGSNCNDFNRILFTFKRYFVTLLSMKKNWYKIILVVFLFFFNISYVYSQESNSFADVENLIVQGKKQSAILEIDSIIKKSEQQKDTLSILKSYDLLTKLYSDDTTDNLKNLLLKKIQILREYSYSKNDTNLTYQLFDSYQHLAKLYANSQDYNTAIEMLTRSLFIIEGLADYRKEVQTLLLLNSIYSKNLDYNKAQSSIKNAIKISRKLSDSTLVLNCLYDLAKTQENFRLYSKAISSLFDALYIAHTTQNVEYEIAINNTIANILFKLGMFEYSLKFLNKNIEIADSSDQISNEKQIEIFIEIGENYLKLNKSIKALEYALKANSLLKDSEFLNYISKNQILLGKIYTSLRNYNKAKEALTKALLIAQKLNDKELLANAYYAIGDFNLQTKDKTLGIYYLQKSLTIAKSESYYNIATDAASLIYHYYKIQNNTVKALKYLEEYSNLKTEQEEINSKISSQKILIEQEYQQNQKIYNQKLTNLHKESNKLKFLLILMTILLISVILLALFFIKKLRVIGKQKNLIEKQKEVIYKQYEKYKLLSFVASHTDNSIFILNTKGQVIWINEALLKLYNTNTYTIFTEKKADFWKLTSYNNPDIIFDTCITARKSITYLSENIINGKSIWIQTTISPIIENNEVTKLIGIETDITKLKNKENEINQQKKDIEFKNKLLQVYNQELKQQKEEIVTKNEEMRQQQEELRSHMELLEDYNKKLKRLSTIVEDSENIIFTFDITGKIIWVNKAFTKYTGYTLKEFMEKYGDNILYASTQKDIEYYFYTCLEKKRAVKYTSKLETKYGKKIWIQTTLTPIKDRNGNVIELAAIDSDITDIKIAEQRIYNQNIEIKTSLEYASKIQKSVLPMKMFINAIFEKNAIVNRPKDFVSGDFYFVHYLNEKSIFVVADCTGHGIPGAFMSILGTMALKMILLKTKSLNPNIIINMLNEELLKLLHYNNKKRETIDSIDIALCVYDFSKSELEYAGANIPLYIYQREQNLLKRIRPSKTTVGFGASLESIVVHSFTLKEGDRIYLSSDGISDQFGGKANKKLKRIGYENMLKEIDKLKMEEVEFYVDNFIDKWMGSNEQVDDMLFFSVEF